MEDDEYRRPMNKERFGYLLRRAELGLTLSPDDTHDFRKAVASGQYNTGRFTPKTRRIISTVLRVVLTVVFCAIVVFVLDAAFGNHLTHNFIDAGLHYVETLPK